MLVHDWFCHENKLMSTKRENSSLHVMSSLYTVLKKIHTVDPTL